MLTLIIVLGAVISALHLRTLIMHEEEHRSQPLSNQIENGEHTWSVISIWNYIMEQYGVPFAHYFVSVTYSIYVRLTIMNVVCFLISTN